MSDTNQPDPIQAAAESALREEGIRDVLNSDATLSYVAESVVAAVRPLIEDGSLGNAAEYPRISTADPINRVAAEAWARYFDGTARHVDEFDLEAASLAVAAVRPLIEAEALHKAANRVTEALVSGQHARRRAVVEGPMIGVLKAEAIARKAVFVDPVRRRAR